MNTSTEDVYNHILKTYLFHFDVKFTMDLSSSEDLYPAGEIGTWIQPLFTSENNTLQIPSVMDRWHFHQHFHKSENSQLIKMCDRKCCSSQGDTVICQIPSYCKYSHYCQCIGIWLIHVAMHDEHYSIQ